MGTTTASFHEGFKEIFEEIRQVRPDLNNNSEVAQEAVRELWKQVRAKERTFFGRTARKLKEKGKNALNAILSHLPSPFYKHIEKATE